jgi:hypothetical protein
VSDPQPNDTERKPKPEPYVFPPELEPYRPWLQHAGREEELVNSPATPFNNWVVFGMHAEMVGQITLLHRLHRAGLLRPAHQAQPTPRDDA